MTSEFPIFVPFGEERLAAIVTIPDVAPRAVVLLLQGLGAPRSHRYQIWTRTARALGTKGLASVRMDYPEVGDSTGSFPAELRSPPVSEATAVSETVLEVLGLDRLGVIGNCLGARTALVMATRMERCTSVASIVPSSPKSFLQGGGKTAPHRAAKRLAHRAPSVAKTLRRVFRTERIEPRIRFVPEVRSALEASDVMFLFLGREEVARKLERGIAMLAEESAEKRRSQVRFIPAGNTSGMRLSLDIQHAVIDGVVRWMDETLPSSRPREDGRSSKERT